MCRPSGDYGQPAETPWRTVNWSAHEHDPLVGGRSLHYVDVGEGERTFVLVYEMGGRWQHWFEAIPALAERGRVLALDLPGFGRSEPAAAGFSLDGFAHTAVELARSLGIERAEPPRGVTKEESSGRGD